MEVLDLRKSLDQNARELLDSSIEILDSNALKEDEMNGRLNGSETDKGT